MSNNPNRSWLHSNPTISSSNLLIQHHSNQFNSIQTSTTTTTTTTRRTTTISSRSSDSSLSRQIESNPNSPESHHTSIGLTLPSPPPPPPERPLLSPLLALAAYAALAMAALTGLAAVLLTGYGLSAFDDARRRLTGVVSAYHPSRPHPNQSSNSTSQTSTHDRFPNSVRTSTRTQPTGYNVQTSMESSEESDEKGSTEGNSGGLGNDNGTGTGTGTGTGRNTQEDTSDFNSTELHPPRPPLTVLVGSVILTLVIVAIRLMVMWWMGQQVPKNTTRAFQNGRRAYEAATRRNLYQSRSMW